MTNDALIFLFPFFFVFEQLAASKEQARAKFILRKRVLLREEIMGKIYQIKQLLLISWPVGWTFRSESNTVTDCLFRPLGRACHNLL